MNLTGRALQSTIDAQGKLTIAIRDVPVGEPGDDDVIVRVEAAPINPSDLGLMLGPADIYSIKTAGCAERPELSLDVPQDRLGGVRGRIGLPLAVGNEGAGTVIAAGRNARALEGKRVAMMGGAMFADYRRIAASEVAPLPDGASMAAGASMFINPLTALGFVETARSEGHKAIVHTAAASNLGQMLQKVCLADKVPLVNIVRSREQADLLRGIGATHVLDSTAGDFPAQLTEAVAATGATIAFDATGGGSLGSTILRAMEGAAVRGMKEYNRYGSDTFKQLYVYGGLTPGPLVLERGSFGFQWDAAGWLIFSFLRKASPETVARMRQRVANELTTTFASHYTQVIGLAEALRPDVLRAYERKATGEKYLIDPTRG